MSPDDKVGGDSLDMWIDMWRDKNSWDIFSLLVGGRHEISSESGVWEREICKVLR